MKGSHPVITLLGSNSGNNLGDAAILSSILEHLSRELPGAEFLVPSSKPSFVNDNYAGRYRVMGISFMPWTGSVRFIGIPTIRALIQSDVALICDGIIFGKKLWNPFFNWLIQLFILVPIARLVGCKVICYSCGIGPFRDGVSPWMARSVLNGCDLVIMREHDSKKLAEEIGVTKPIEVTGDAAFINPVSSDERATELARELGIDLTRPLLGINVTKYMDAWLGKEEKISDRSAFLKEMAEGIKRAQERIAERYTCLVFSTHPMDETGCRELASLIDGVVVSNRSHLSHDIQALMRRCSLFMGMRFHSVILASAVEVPIVGLIYAPKVKGYMRLLECEDVAIELNSITASSFADVIVKAWEGRRDLQARQKAVIDELKAGALRAATLVRERYFPKLRPGTQPPEITQNAA